MFLSFCFLTLLLCPFLIYLLDKILKLEKEIEEIYNLVYSDNKTALDFNFGAKKEYNCNILKYDNEVV